MKAVIRYKGGKGSGFHGHPGGKGGKGNPGGSQSIGNIKVEFYDPSPNAYGLYGYREGTAEERKKFVDSINQLPPEIKSLWKGDSPVILAIKPDDKWYGTHQSHWIVLGEDSFNSISQHEFVHHIVSQYTDKLGAYKPKNIINHAMYQKDFYNRMDEDLTCVLSGFSKDIESWAYELGRSDGVDGSRSGVMGTDVARQKIKDALDFVEWLRRHDE